MNEIIGLPAEVSTALALIATGVIVPAVTSLLSYRGIPKWLKRALPIALAALGAVVIVVLQGGGPFAEQLTTWLLVAATVVGIAQAVYAAMPGAWKKLEQASTASTEPLSGPARGQGGTNTPRGHRGPPEALRSSESGLERSAPEEEPPAEPRA